MRAKTTPWQLGPHCATARAKELWDWKSRNAKLPEFNKARIEAGLPPMESKGGRERSEPTEVILAEDDNQQPTEGSAG